MRAGDQVLHRPSGEAWTVAYADAGSDILCPCGWPHSLSRLSDCEMIKSATEAEHRALLLELSSLNDSRGDRARRALAKET